jgi:hypothetical protein
MRFGRSRAVAASTFIVLPAAAMVIGGAPHPVRAQNSTALANIVPQSESATIQARISAIDAETRAVTLVGGSGETVSVIAGPAVRLEMLKVGDRVNAQFYRSVAFMVRPPAGGNGTPVSDDQMRQVLAQPAQAPGVAGIRLTKISGTIVGIDMAAHRVNLVDPTGGAIRSIDVTDPARIAMLGSLKVGDTVTAVVSEAFAVSIEPAQRRWF